MNHYIESLLFHFNPPETSFDNSHDKQFILLSNDLLEENLEKLTSVQLHEFLSIADKPTSIRRHPNEDRKTRSGFSYRGLFRFHRCCLLWLTCQKQVLERFINDQIKSMFDRGLINELEEIHDEYNQTYTQTEQLYNYIRGIFQAIDFKEFHDYLLLLDIERKSEYGEKVFANGG
ncbi:unnamed protein product, partial [Rotaria sp. Silwood2]